MLPPALTQLLSILSEQSGGTEEQRAVLDELVQLDRNLPGPFIGQGSSSVTDRYTGPGGVGPTQTDPGDQKGRCWLCGRS